MPVIKISLALSCIRCKYVAFKGGSLHSKISKTVFSVNIFTFPRFWMGFGDLNFRWVFNDLNVRAVFFLF